ncbi:Hypothetical protein D9617_7g031100 [Elsinoe fawcettii]|nr:Hypothetical protein D9617_7g031100 [Elsinoe fawcettii]
MNAHSYLTRHGWTPGTSLHPHKSHSIKKPLLISRKVDVLGIGLNKNTSVSDQWWLRAFDSSLKALGTGKKGALDGVKEHGVRRGGLYGRFVKGETVEGTLGKRIEGAEELVPKDATNTAESVDGPTDQANMAHMKRKRSDSDSSEPHRKRSKPSKYPVAAGADVIGADGTEGKKISVKTEKHAREKAARVAKREARAAAGIVVESNKKKENNREAKKEAKAKVKDERQKAKAIRQEEKKAARAIVKEKMKAEDEERIKQGLEPILKGDVKKVSKTKAEKREIKLRARAIANGVDVEELRKDDEGRKAAEEDAVKEAALPARAEKVGFTLKEYRALPSQNLYLVKKMLKEFEELSDKKKARYVDRASEKGVRTEAYFVSKRLKKHLGGGSAEETNETEMHTVNAGDAKLSFVVDTTGDAALPEPKLSSASAPPKPTIERKG